MDGHLDDLDRLRRAGLHAGGRFAAAETLVAHVALPYDTEAVAVLRHVVGALQHTVLAADALVIEVAHDASDRILLIHEHRTAVEAARISAVVAGRGDGLLVRSEAIASADITDIAPGCIFLESVEGMA